MAGSSDLTVTEIANRGERSVQVGEPVTHADFMDRARYRWAAERLGGRVLEVASGSGYGTPLLTAAAGRVVAMDLSLDALRFGRDVYGSTAARAACRLPDIPAASSAFDTVVTFETVEHVEDDTSFLREVRRVLRPGGSMLLSTPNAAVTSPDRVVRNPWHVREYLREELVELVAAAGFSSIEVLGQGAFEPSRPNQALLRAVARFPRLCRPGRWWDRRAHGHPEVRPLAGGEPVFFVVVAR